MCSFHGLEELEVLRFGWGNRDCDRICSLERELTSTAPPHSGEDGASAFGRVRGVDKKVRAADNANNDLRVDDERQADSILFSAKEALRAVDGVDSPHSWRMLE